MSELEELTPDEHATFHAAYCEDRKQAFEDCEPPYRIFAAVVFPSYEAWCAEQGVRPPSRDVRDPYAIRRMREYAAWCDEQLLPIDPAAHSRVHLPPFEQWLADLENLDALYALFPETERV